MPISALIITLASNADQHQLRSILTEMPEIELGPIHGRRWPIVTETASLEQGRALVERVQALSGVAQVDVLLVHFEDVHFEDVHFEDLDVGGSAPPGARRWMAREHG